MTISDSAVEDNVFAGTTSSAGAGGVSVGNAPGVGVVVSRSSISRNRVDPPTGTNTGGTGGLEVIDSPTLSVTDLTVSGNTVSAEGVTDFRIGGIDTTRVAATTLTNVTVTDNVAGAGSGFVANNLSYFGATRPASSATPSSPAAHRRTARCLGRRDHLLRREPRGRELLQFQRPGDLFNTARSSRRWLHRRRSAGAVAALVSPLWRSRSRGRSSARRATSGGRAPAGRGV